MAAEMPPSEENTRRFPSIPVLIILALLAMALFGEKGLLRSLQYHRQNQALGAEIRSLEIAREDLRQEIRALRDDMYTIEQVARRELGMVKEDEIVYQFKPADQ